jgi:biopolymer transport protein ExbB
MPWFLLQVDSQLVQQAVANTTQKQVQLLNKGGWIMYPLYALLAASIFVFTERFLAIKKASSTPENFMNIIRDNIVTGNISAAKSLAKNTNTGLARIIEKGILRIGKPIDAIEKSMEM